jgi:hypothetical protein
MNIFIDVSNYQNCYTFEQFKLLITNGVTGVIIRAGCAHDEDDMLPTFVKWCRELGIPFANYFYFYPGLLLTSQIELFVELATEYPDCTSLWVDVEEYKNFTTGIVYSADALNAFYKTIFMRLKVALPNKFIGNYSGNWVLDKYIPKFYTWASVYPYWNAYYVKYFPWWWAFIASLGGSWDSDLLPISITNLRKIMETINLHPVPKPIGMTKIDGWQCITFIPFKELTYWQRRLDLNICTDESYFRIFGNNPNIPPIPPPPPIPSEYVTYFVVPMVGVNVRATPSLTGIKLGALPYMTAVIIQTKNITAGWGQIFGGKYSGGWVYLANMKVLN